MEPAAAKYMKEWGLIPDGDSFRTHSSILQPVLCGEQQAMLKIPLTPDEKAGCRVLDWWDGIGAVRVIRSDADAVLMERLADDHALKSMAMSDRDDEATRIICQVASVLHSDRHKPLPELVPLRVLFEDLFRSADKYGGPFPKAAEIARSLLDNQVEIVVLHGDLHHDNILHSPERGWLAIDPKGLLGDRAFDYVNILRNPSREIALSEGRFMRQIGIIGEESGIAIDRLLKWTAAWSGLAAVWHLEDDTDNSASGGIDASLTIEILKIALAECGI